MTRYLILFMFFGIMTIAQAITLNNHSEFTIMASNQDTIKTFNDSVSARRDTLRSHKDSSGTWIRDSSGVWKRDTSTTADSVARKKHYAERDTVIPIIQSTLSNNSYILSNNELQRNDYRYTPDFFKLFEFGYLGETGNLGAPDELYLYGYGTSNINYLDNGIPLNSLPYLLFDLNYVQSEAVDSIEIIPSPRGFLYGTYNKPVSVNFISKDFISRAPYTRIKYYQGAFGEAMFDGIFNSNIYKKLPVFFDVTNRKLDQRFTNSDFSSWQVTTQVKYLLSDSINFMGNYSFSKIYKALNGGVNVDTIALQGLDLNTYIYDEINAFVNNYSTDMDVTQHNFSLRMIAKPYKGAITDVSIYYKFNSQSLNNINDDINNYEKTKDKLYGINFNQKYSDSTYDLNLIAGYEHSNLLDNPFNDFSFKEQLISFAAIAGVKLNDRIKGSVFFKYSNLNNESPSIQKISMESNGIGADFNIKITDPFSLYFGYSLLKDYFTTNYFGRGEISANWSAEDLFIKISAFTANNSYKEPGDIYTSAILLMIPDYYSTENCTNINGLAINFKYRIKFLSLENNSSYYTGAHSGLLTRANGLAGIPTIYSKSGIFISDSLFSNNLNMKGGFAFTYYDKINYYTPNNLLPETSPAYILDFTLAGRIRNTATIYFTWENLLDFKYFLIPYYPNLGRNLKFGVAWDLFN